MGPIKMRKVVDRGTTPRRQLTFDETERRFPRLARTVDDCEVSLKSSTVDNGHAMRASSAPAVAIPATEIQIDIQNFVSHGGAQQRGDQLTATFEPPIAHQNLPMSNQDQLAQDAVMQDQPAPVQTADRQRMIFTREELDTRIHPDALVQVDGIWKMPKGCSQ
jgi:hypothetical protein